MKRLCLLFFTGAALLTPLSAATGDDSESSGEEILEADRDEDGVIDYVIKLNEAGIKTYEELDYNYDGKMDDFYYYTNGVLQRREIDTNYDAKIDVWVFLHEGVYIKRYEQDTDYDGEVDVVKDFDKTKKEKGEAGN
jgi:hypothetical protein